MGRKTLISCTVTILLPFAAQAATLQVGPTRALKTLPAAASAARAGDVIEIDAGTYTQGAQWNADNLLIRTAPGAAAGSVIVSGGTVAGKALFVTDGQNITIDGLRFQNAFVRDQNGAGIRMQGRNLTVLNSSFGKAEHGILVGSSDPESTLTVRNSQFHDFYSPGGSGVLTHGLYVGNSIGELVVEDSTFSKNVTGHLVKSRALRTTIRDVTLDGRQGTSSYLIDVPEGGQLVVEDSELIKGANSPSNTAIAYGFERYKGGQFVNPDGFVFIGNNSFTNYRASGTNTFIENRTDVEIELHENALTAAAGRVELVRGPHVVTTAADLLTPIEGGPSAALPIGDLPPFEDVAQPSRHLAGIGNVSSTAVAVPAPAAVGLFVAGLALVGTLRRRRKV